MKNIEELTNDEAYEIVLMVMREGSSAEDAITIDEIDVRIILNDGGLMLDSDVLVYVDLTVRCFLCGLCFMDDGIIKLVDDNDETHPINKIQVIEYLENQGYDVSIFKVK